MKRNMRRNLVFSLIIGIVALIALTALAPAPVGAHPPQKVVLAYDAATQTLSVTVTHTRFSAGHYIEKIEIRKNGAVAVAPDYKSQPSESFTYAYKIIAAKGDSLEAKATCNKFGSATEKLTVGK